MMKLTSLREEELELSELIGFEARIEGDEGEAPGVCPGGEEGVHPKFGCGDAGDDVAAVGGIQLRWFHGQEGGSLIEHEFFPDEPGGGGSQSVATHDGAIGEEAENGLLDGTTPAASGGPPVLPPCRGSSMVLVALDEDRQPDVGINEGGHEP